jgi:hypothetical protein
MAPNKIKIVLKIKPQISDLRVNKIKIFLKIKTLPDCWINKTMKYSVHYPERPQRDNTSLYNQSQKLLCEINDIPCLICGRNRQKDGVVTEAHHIMRHSSMNGIDWVAFGQKAKNLYHLQTGECMGLGFNWDEVAQNPTLFVDSCLNLMVLCPEHHRGKYQGLHNLAMPDWLSQIAPKPGFEFIAKVN